MRRSMQFMTMVACTLMFIPVYAGEKGTSSNQYTSINEVDLKLNEQFPPHNKQRQINAVGFHALEKLARKYNYASIVQKWGVTSREDSQAFTNIKNELGVTYFEDDTFLSKNQDIYSAYRRPFWRGFTKQRPTDVYRIENAIYRYYCDHEKMVKDGVGCDTALYPTHPKAHHQVQLEARSEQHQYVSPLVKMVIKKVFNNEV